MTKYKDAYYFPHDSNARNDPRLVRIRKDHGMAGYGVYFCLIEMLRESKTYYLPVDYSTISFDLRVDEKLVKSIVEDYDLFTMGTNGKSGQFFSNSLIKRMQRLDNIRLKRVAAGRKGAKQRYSKAKAKPLAKKTRPIASKHNITKHNITIKNIVRPKDELFEEIWSEYPNKDSKKKSLEYFLRTVNNEQDYLDIWKCLRNYLTHLEKNEWKKPQSGKTWFGNWSDRSWLNFKEPKEEERQNDAKQRNLLED